MAAAGSGQPLLDWLRLVRSRNLGNAAALKLVQHFGSAEAALAVPQGRWAAAGVAKAAEIPAADDAQLQADLAWLDGPDADAIPFTDPRYPQNLREGSNPPLLLFVRGSVEVLAQPQIAIVGARSATPQGLENAKAFARSLTERGVLVTSGLALGVDGAAHQGALEAQGPTIAVCATGLDRVYPARHKPLAHAIVAAGGALVSEFAPGTEALAAHFPRRNRLIAGLSLGTLVVEASLNSGSLITARLAAEIGREVFAIPGSIHNPLARGCHRLIRDGAKLVESVDDILLELAPKLSHWLLQSRPAVPTQASQQPVLDAASQKLLAALSDAPQSVDALIAKTALPAELVNAHLLTLELDGLIDAHLGNYLLAPRTNNR